MKIENRTPGAENTSPGSTLGTEAMIVFRPADYGGDISAFKTAYAAAFASSLRQSGGPPAIVGFDELTREQYGAVLAVFGNRVREDRLGSGNLLTTVRSSFHGKPCGSLKRHFIGCERQLIGLAELMAARDSERFVWVTVRSWQKHAKKKDGTVYSKSYIFHRLQVLESLGLLLPVCRYRNRTLRQGFLVTRHEDVAHIEGEHCLLTIQKRTISPRKPGEKRTGISVAPNREQYR
jgi:hypothetical protein